jgi:hypothetical protein
MRPLRRSGAERPFGCGSDRFAGRDDVAFAVEGCTGWRYVAEELALVGVAVHLAEPAVVPAGTAGAALGGVRGRQDPRRGLRPPTTATQSTI